jgi:ferredoxin
LRVTVDNAVCQGHAQCHHICPEVFDIDDAGYSILRTDVVPPGQEAAARDAELSCPEGAIHIVD